ncbi:hypothetical protein RJ639_029759 [Escallonia herrerae]|uniref:Trehalose 6-phosphate phosphatase n=1 Tax=Escallonia herrerae TaxID=1293975 RepID=A0AA89BNU3_9ASTE|nr:hypothetical protein RJ639_029759 [Escallonia herrerae]
MDLKSSKVSPVLADPAPMNKSRLGIHSSLLPYSQSGASFSSTVLTIPRKKPGKLDDVRSNGWLDAMQSSSPPRKKILKDSTIEVSSDLSDNGFHLWMLKYPSALSAFEQIIVRAKSKKIVIFLDYDGTLSPIVDDPDRAFISADGKEVNLFQPASEFLPMIDEVFRTLVENTKEIKGAKVENHKFCASVHYRNVDENSWPTIAQCVHDILNDYPQLRLTHGRKVLEVRPVIDWDKGKAVEFVLESLGLSNSDDLLPIYIGDDKTDEDAFKVLREGNRGYGILVSSVPKESNAFFSLRDPLEVKKFLKSLVRWKERNA